MTLRVRPQLAAHSYWDLTEHYINFQAHCIDELYPAKHTPYITVLSIEVRSDSAVAVQTM